MSDFLPEKFRTALGKIFQTTREEIIVPEKNQQNSTREKKIARGKVQILSEKNITPNI